MTTLFEYHNTGDNTVLYAAATGWLGQTFTVGSSSHTITSIKLKLFRIGTPGTVTIGIRATDGNGHPTGGDLTSGTIDGDTLTTDDAGEWYEISLTEYTLPANTKYATVLRAPTADPDTEAVGWRCEWPGTYAGMNGEHSADSGVTWLSLLDYWGADGDFMFEVWGNAIAQAFTKSITQAISVLSLTVKRPSKPVSQSVSVATSPVKATKKVQVQSVVVLSSLCKGPSKLGIQDILVLLTRIGVPSAAIFTQSITTVMSSVKAFSKVLTQPVSVLASGTMLRILYASRVEFISVMATMPLKQSSKLESQTVSVFTLPTRIFSASKDLMQPVLVTVTVTKGMGRTLLESGLIAVIPSLVYSTTWGAYVLIIESSGDEAIGTYIG